MHGGADEPGRVRARCRASACATRPSRPRSARDRITPQRLRRRRPARCSCARASASPTRAAEATWAYNLNGQVTTVIDGNGNRAELRYDGHGRQDRWTFPSHDAAGRATTTPPRRPRWPAPAASTPRDYEDYGYDANGNRTSLAQARRRDARPIAYDALNRMTVEDRARPGRARRVHERDVYLRLRPSAACSSTPGSTARPGEGVTNAYDGFGRLASSSTNHGRHDRGRSPTSTTATATAPGSPIPNGDLVRLRL